MTVNPDSPLTIVRNVADLRSAVSRWRATGGTVALVPTMGALHDGHLSLVRLGKKKADRVVASIFINPAQFAPHEDLDAYPRQEREDLVKLASAGCDLAFLPAPEEMYPDGFATSVSVDGLSEGLCGASRPHFFGGVATVVTKLLNQARADIAIFGEKDYQQLLIIRRLARDLDTGTHIIGAPIIREPDGLAMSSRNQYLSIEEREVAGQLNLLLRSACQSIAEGATVAQTLAGCQDRLLSAGFDKVDYLECRDGRDLAPLSGSLSGDTLANARLFAAALIGKTRLIDNMAVSRN